MEEDLVRNRDLMSEDQLARKSRDLRRERREFQRELSRSMKTATFVTTKSCANCKKK